MPAPVTTPELLELVRKSGLVPGECLNQLATTELPAEPVQAAGVLIAKQLLTPFQAKLLLVGRHKGFRIGPYLVTDLLGQGGMGTVYKAEHAVLHRSAAVKVLTDHTDPLTLDRFHREARAAAALDHANIVRTHDGGRDGDVHYIVMEWVDGRTLDQVIESDGPLPLATAVNVIAQAATGLQHAHERGFLHRDIKPANLILAADGTVKILDMGLARSTNKNDSLTAKIDKASVVGTADYMSPEQVKNDPALDIRSDIYSLGATFYALLTGRPLFGGSTVSKLAQHQLKPPDLTDLGEGVPPKLVAILKKMLAKRPADRYQTPAEVAAVLGPWCGNNSPAPNRHSAGHRTWPMWVAASVLIASVGSALAYVLIDRNPQPVAGYPTTGLAPPSLPPLPQSVAPAPPLFRLDTSALKPFSTSGSRQNAWLSPETTGLPRGINFIAYRKGASGTFSAMKKDSGLVLAVANETSELSSQFYFQLESELGVKLEDNEDYRMTVEYATDPNAEASVAIQTMRYKDVFRLPLSDTNGRWRTVTRDFTRPANTPVRATFENGSFTENLMQRVYLRRFEIALLK